MRTFLGTYWKVLVALIILILLAVVTMSSGSASPSLAARLRTHVQALAGDGNIARPERAARHIESALAADGYRVRREEWHGGEGAIEVSVGNLAPGAAAERTFIVGANGANGSGAAAALELARLLGKLRPSPGTEVRFVFFVNQGGLAAAASQGGPRHAVTSARYPDTGNFIAFVGSPAASRQVQQTLSAFRAASDFPAEGLAAPAYVQGVTISGHAPCARCGGRTLTISDSAFLGYPYYHTGDEEELDYDAIARVVNALSRAIGMLAEGQRG